MNGAINLEGSGELRVRYRAINAAGDLIAGTTGLTTLHANASASGDGFARFLLQRATGSVINRVAFNDTVLDSNLYVRGDNGHVSLGNITVNGGAPRVLWVNGGIAATTATGIDYTNITGAAGSELIFTGNNNTLTFATPL